MHGRLKKLFTALQLVQVAPIDVWQWLTCYYQKFDLTADIWIDSCIYAHIYQLFDWLNGWWAPKQTVRYQGRESVIGRQKTYATWVCTPFFFLCFVFLVPAQCFFNCNYLLFVVFVINIVYFRACTCRFVSYFVTRGRKPLICMSSKFHVVI